MLSFLTLPFLLFALLSSAEARTSTEWQSRTIYQILTDRFARTDNSTQPCSNLADYCGGTFRGIMNNLDYIAGMGFDAIWISPIVDNIDKGYHGYWAKDFNKINLHFGTEEDLHMLIDECHKRDIWVMVDIVANHIGPVGSDYTGIVPFNDSSFYHEVCQIVNFTNINMTEILNCRLSDLPDLAQENQEVKSFLLNWIKDLVQKYKIDGLRIDTVPYVPRDFMAEFVKSAGVFSFGEVFLGNNSFIISYQEAVPGILNYPLYDAMKEVFINEGSMKNIQDYYKNIAPLWKDEKLLGSFVDNHDNARFLNKTSNLAALKSALAFSLTSIGIPIVYQGDEQAFNGGDDPKNREPLWTSLNSSSEVYQLIYAINQVRKLEEFYKEAQIERDCDEKFYSFSRGELFFAFTNSLEDQTREIKNHSYAEGTTLCNVLDPSRKDCTIVSQGTFEIALLDGEVKIFAPIVETQKKNFMVALFGGLFAITALAGVFVKYCWYNN